MAKRASDLAGVRRRVIAVSRFSASEHEARLQAHGVETLRADLLDADSVTQLPDAAHVIFMAGRKFGSSGHESLTWAMNCHVPALVSERFADSRIVAFSTGNVYGLTPVGQGGSREDDLPRPFGEYAMSCLGRERILEHFSRTNGTPMSILRLNYAVELRYGVLVDLATRILAGAPVDAGMGYVNVIWQADANAAALAALAHVASPPLVVNVAGPEELSVRELANALSHLLDKPAVVSGEPSSDALLSNGARGWALFGRPRVDAAQVVRWTADWLKRGGATLDKPTHFESRDGMY